MINVTGLKKSFGALEVLKGIDLQVAAGDVAVLIGPSGCGKSTFLRCLNLLEITIMTPEALRLRHEPAADCARYDGLRRAL